MDPMTVASSTSAERVVRWVPPLIVLAFFSVTAAGYGVFRDELYYFACARHLDWGYVDHPPMIAALAAIVRAVFGDSWLAARWLSAVAAAGTVLLVGDTARELGGGRWARLLAQLLCATAPVYLALFSIFSMPQFFADMHGWRDLAEAVAKVAATLPADERREVCVYGGNYGEAGAIDFFRSALDLPPAISGHNSYWLWGPGSCRGAVLLVIGGRAESHARYFGRVEVGTVFRCAYCMPFEDNLTIWVVRVPTARIDTVWPALKRFI